MYSARDLSAGLLALIEHQDAPEPGSTGRQKRPSALVVCSSDETWGSLHEILEHAGWRVRRATGCFEAGELSKADCFPVIISESSLPDGDWKDLHWSLRQCAPTSAFIVTSRVADENLWAEVLNLGAYDVLVQPLHSEEVVRVCCSAWRQAAGMSHLGARAMCGD